MATKKPAKRTTTTTKTTAKTNKTTKAANTNAKPTTSTTVKPTKPAVKKTAPARKATPAKSNSASEKQSGKQALDTQVRNILIEQEAKKEGVTVSDQEVNDQMKSVQAKLASQGQNIDQVLAMQGMTKNDLRNLMRLDKLVQKMVGKN